ncbi:MULTISPECIES: TlyA family RNA methyltransferase [Laceyella]|uniref:TlyA family RNA methyltransferase n=2 Tax=Laceyella TaxID=292635 RepID=A0ABY5U1B1_LACSH|nr:MULTISPECIES: TlyA family RNA methyltransferase [Laceyella]PRZ16328.1 23S rRNA (cytidine1920-2'-O)/16S rRNA (cytidine1409-2'-O)-methyltransferase [Laceyella sediminis]UWE03414.1 TlyA family RNA methyltransferase [Laceyella sacchari]
MAAKKKQPLWEALIDRGFFEDRKTATSWIMMGKVLVNQQRASNAGEMVKEDANIQVKGIDLKYVGKGGLKLEGAIAQFGIDVNGRVCLDTGASTGGFTDCLIQHGASRTYAIDVGFGQLAGKLRQDERVVNMEKTNIGDVKVEHLTPRPSLATVDLSYLSLKKAIPIISELLDENGEMLCLVKPLFEIEDSKVRRTGEIESPDQYKAVLEDLVEFSDEFGLNTLGVTHSPVTGNKGTHEFFLWTSLDKSKERRNLDEDIRTAIDRVMKLQPYKNN